MTRCCSPPTGILDTTRVLTPLPAPPVVSPFASLLNPSSASVSRTEAGAHLARHTADVLGGAALESTLVRRWTYRSTGPVERGSAPRRVEVEFELDNEGELPTVREMKVVGSEVRVVRENKVDVMVPTGCVLLSLPLSFNQLTKQRLTDEPSSLQCPGRPVLDEHDDRRLARRVPERSVRPLSLLRSHAPRHALALTSTHSLARSDERTMTFHAQPPLRLSLLGDSFMLDTDHVVRRTVITPAPSTSSTDDKAEDARSNLVTVQEAWHSLMKDAARGTDVFALVGEGDVGALQADGSWKRGLEEVERRCLGRGSGFK